MNIERHVYTISHIAKGYKDSDENGVVAFDGKLISWNGPTVNKQTKYFRILIKKK